MCSMTRIILCITFLNLFVFVQCAPELPNEDNYGIISTESAIRNTLNGLFSILKLKVIQNKLKLKQYSTIHNVFASITLRDHKNLKKIAKLTEADNIDNGTQVFITQLNEVLNEDNKSDEETDSVYITFLIEDFINRLDNLKDRHDVKNNTKNFDLNKAIIRYFNKNEFGNTTCSKDEFVEGNYSNENVLSDIEMWQPSGRRIFQGEETEIRTFPFMASIQFFRTFQCGGSIIKADLIITSASCLQIAWNNRFFRENPLFLSVQVGSSFYNRGGEHIPVQDIYFHPGFIPKTLRHNLAIIRLTSLLYFWRKQQKVKSIPFDNVPSPMPSNVDDITVIGWGVKNFAGAVITERRNKLSFATLPFYPLVDCQEIYSKEFVTDRNFCAGYLSKGAGACNHDAGGPGLSGGILTGVISFGAPVCGTADAPTVFTKLGYYTDWIEEILEMDVLTAHQHTTVRSIGPQTFRLPPVTMRFPSRITPIVNGKSSNPSIIYKPDIARTDDKEHKFKEFLKTLFTEKVNKKKKGHLKQEKSKVDETEKVTGFSYESEDTDTPHTTQELTQFPNERHKVKERHKFTVVPIMRNKAKTSKEKNIKPSSSKPKKKLTPKQKNRWLTESQSESIDKTPSVQPSTMFGSVENTDDSSSPEAPNSDKQLTSSFRPLVYHNEEASASHDTEFDEAIENLINKINLEIDYKSETKENSKKHDLESNPDLIDTDKYKTKKLKKTKSDEKLKHFSKKNKHKNDSHNKRDKHDNKNRVSSENEGDEENVSSEYKSDNNPKSLTNIVSSKKAKYVESVSTEIQENSENEEVVHTVHMYNKKHKKYYKKGDEDKTDED